MFNKIKRIEPLDRFSENIKKYQRESDSVKYKNNNKIR